MSCDSNDDELKLTEEYKYLLSYIRPLIDQLDKSKDAQLCLLWLSKLEQSASWEKNSRNKILSELCKQVKSNHLKPPFNTSPPNGPLQNVFYGDWTAQDSVVQECSEIEASTEDILSSCSHHSVCCMKNMHKHQMSPNAWKPEYFCSTAKNRGMKPHKEIVDHSECFAIQKAYHERAQSDQMVIERYQDIIKSLVSQQLKTDISPSRLKKLQSNYEVKMAELLQVVKRVQEENEALKRKLNCFGGEMDKINVLKKENEDLRKEIFDLESAKNALEARGKKNEEKLLALSDLVSKLNAAEKKLKDKEKQCQSLEKKFEDSYRICESEYQTRINEKDKLHTAELSTLERLLEEKQAEINSLKEQVMNQNAHFDEEISSLKQQMADSPSFGKEDNKKMKNLKVRAKKLEKMRDHMTVLFQSQLQQILAKKDFYIASLEMQLKMSNPGSGGSMFNSDFCNSLYQKVSNLEAQYKKLLEDSEQQYIKRRQMDLQKIHTLEKKLLSFGGIVEDKESDMDQKDSLWTTKSGREHNTKDGKAL